MEDPTSPLIASLQGVDDPNERFWRLVLRLEMALQAIHSEIGSIRQETGGINEKIKVQNGRVGKSEDRLDAIDKSKSSHWLVAISRRPWFPWLIALFMALVGGKSLGEIANVVLQWFKPH